MNWRVKPLPMKCQSLFQVQPSVGWPLFVMGLQRGNAPLILRGIVRENRAWCRVLEFAEEFGVSVSFEPFMLWERRGG